MTTRREILLREGMRLFGEQGYAATSIAQIEEAAGLSPGSGSFYKHFASKQQMLEAGLDKLLSSAVVPPPASEVADRPRDVLELAAKGGFARMEEDRDLSRIVFRGLQAFPELLKRFGNEEIARRHAEITRLLADLSGDASADWEAIAVVLQGATAHYWLLADVFGEHPTGVSQERVVRALADLATLAVGMGPHPGGEGDGRAAAESSGASRAG